MSKEKQLTDVNFFICSTFLDLKPYRDAVIEKIKSEAGVINAQEFFGARDQKPIETCIQEVEKSNVFVMFLAGRLGSIDPVTNKSFVQLEYEKAKELGLPKFVYIMDEDYPYPIKFVSTGDESKRLIEFKNHLLADLTIDKFTSPDDLANKVIQDLLRDLPKFNIAIGEPKIDRTASDTVQLIKAFLALPKRFYAREFNMKIELKEFERAPDDECQAFSMTYGSTLKRSFRAIDEKVSDALSYMLSSIYAQDDLAERLIAFPEKSTATVTVRTVQGKKTWQEAIYKYEEIDDLQGLLSPYSAVTAAAVVNWSLIPRLSSKRKERMLSRYETHEALICGLELVKVLESSVSKRKQAVTKNGK